MLTMTGASNPRTIIADNGNPYLVLGSGGETDGLSQRAAGYPETLQGILDSDAAASVLIIVVDPVTGLGSALEAERSIDSARAAWASSTAALLKVWRGARRRVRIVNRACLSGDESDRAALKPLGLADAAAEFRLGQSASAILSPLSLLCAAMMIQSDPALQRLARELEAATIGVGRSVDMWNATSEAWSAAGRQEAMLGSLHLEAQNAVVLEQRLAEAASVTIAKATALEEAQAKFAAAIKQNSLHSLLEQSLALASAASKKQETAHKKITAKLHATELELELLRDTVGLQSGALEDATGRLRQLEQMTSQVKKLEVEAVALGQKLAIANGDLRAAQASRGSLESELEDLRHEARFARIADSVGDAGFLRSLSLAQTKRTSAAIRYPRPDAFVPSEVQIRDDWTANLQVGKGGERNGTEIVSRRKSGHVFFGPYVALPTGSYAADVQINLRSGLFKSQGYFLEVVSRDEVIASSPLELARGYNRFLMPFRISTGRGVSELEVRLFSPGTNDIALTKLRLLESGSTTSAAEQNMAAPSQTAGGGAMPGLQGAAARTS